MKRYPVYKDSGIEWLGDIPAHWKIIRLKYVAKVQTGITLGNKYQNLALETKPYLRVANVQDGYLDLSEIKTIDLPKSESEKYILQKGDVLMTEGGDFDKLGRGYVWEGQIENCLHQNHIFAVKPNKIYLNSYFLAALLSSSYVKNYFIYTSKQTTNLASTNSSILKKIDVLLPDLVEQNKILEFITHKLAQIDQFICYKRRLIELLNEQKIVLIDRAISKGLNPNVPSKPSGIEWLEEIPVHWEAERGKVLFAESHLPVRENDGIVTAFRDGQVTLRENRRTDGFMVAIKETGYQGVRRGQLVIHSMDAFAGAIGVSESDGKCTPEYIVCTERHPGIVPEYYVFCLRKMARQRFIEVYCPAVRERAPRIRYSSFGKMRLPVPPSEEQREIVDYIHRESKHIDTAIAQAEKEIELIQEYRTTLISDAVTGKIDVRDTLERGAALVAGGV